MSNFIKRHIGLILILIIAIVFPASLSNQAKLNMRIIVTGLAIDKNEDQYEVTAQIVKTVSGTESPGTGAEIEFISDSAETVSKAISKLLYKAGKVSAFSHTNFLILGNSILKEDATKCLDVFLRDKIIKNSAMILFSKNSAKDEIQKTKNLELSVGLGLQKVYSFKQEENDGLMVTILDFMNENNTYGKTATTSLFELVENDASGDGGTNGSGGNSSGGLSQDSSNMGDSSSSSGDGNSKDSSGGDSQNSSSSGSTESGSSSGGSSGGGSSSGGDKNSKMYFAPNTPTYVFVDGKFALEISDEKENSGYLLTQRKTKTSYIELANVDDEKLKSAKISIIIKNKKVSKKVHFNNNIPCLDLHIVIDNSEVNEINSDEKNKSLSNEQLDKIKFALKKEIEKNIGSVFEKTKESGADIFKAYEIAYKFNYGELTKLYSSSEDFIKNLNLSVSVDVLGLES